MQQLWGEMCKDFQTSAGETDEAALSRAIGKRMGIPTSKVTLPIACWKTSRRNS